MENEKKGTNKLAYGIVAVILIIIILVLAYFLLFNKNTVKDNLDLNAISNSITTTGGYDQMATMDVTKEILESNYNIPSTDVEEVYGKMPMMNVQASLYIVIKAVDGKAGEVKQKLEEFGNSYQQQWETYLPAQLELVNKRIIGNKGDYVYIIIAENATELEKLIK